MKEFKYFMKDKLVILFCAFVLGTGMFSIYQESNESGITPNNDYHEATLYRN